MSKFTKTLVLLLLGSFAATLWWNFPTTLFIRLTGLLLIMSWATIIDTLRKKK